MPRKGAAIHPKAVAPTLSYVGVYIFVITSGLRYHVGSDEENLETIS